MPDTVHIKPHVATSEPLRARMVVWNRRLITGVIVLILWAASILALQMARPRARALMDGEGMLVSDDQ